MHWKCLGLSKHLLSFPLHSGHRGRPNRRGPEGDDRQVFTWRLNGNDALQTFLIFDHRFEALVGRACSRIAGENGSSMREWDDGKGNEKRPRMGLKDDEEKRGGEEVKKEWWTLDKTKIYRGIAGKSPNESRFLLLLRSKVLRWLTPLRISTSADLKWWMNLSLLHDHLFQFLF